MDGITAAGKSTLARALASAVADRGRPAIHVSMDGFHHPRAHRHRRGRDSAVGYYQDAYEFPAFARTVLSPLGPGGDWQIDERPVAAAADTVLIVDGSFLGGHHRGQGGRLGDHCGEAGGELGDRFGHRGGRRRGHPHQGRLDLR
ncbi:hypothetical protein [Streptomyces sp. NPDC048606]|uniref:hypothetical protein n=1 Tax=Streptomyces sp. NPDC048606 TaxID=3154726 RepID=UPI00343603AD